MKNYCIIGSTGLIGSALVDKLLTKEQVGQVSSVSRRNLELADSNNPELLKQLVFDDLSVSDLNALNLASDIFICCLGTTKKQAGSKKAFEAVDKDLVVGFAKLAKRSGARSLIVVSALGADKSSFIFYNRVKGEMEEELKKLDFESLYFLRPSLLIADRKESRLGEAIGIKIYKFLNKFISDESLAVFGTKAKFVVDKIIEVSQEPKPGKHIIENF